jgi:hypothetical protein
MRAIVQARNAHGNYSARTENNLLVVFTVDGPEALSVNDEVEFNLLWLFLSRLLAVFQSQRIVRLKDGHTCRIRVKGNDIHDLDLPPNHGSSRVPSLKRMFRT